MRRGAGVDSLKIAEFKVASMPFVGAVVVCLGAVVGALSLLLGASPAYTSAQFCAFLALAAYLLLAKRLPFTVNLMVIGAATKNFLLSQVVKIFLWQSPEVGMAAPVNTAWVVTVGILGCIGAALIYIALFRGGTGIAILSRPIPPDLLGPIGWTFFIIGAIAKPLSLNPSASVAFYYLSVMLYAAAAVFSSDSWQKRRKVMDWRVGMALFVGLAMSLPSQSKSLVLVPFVVGTALYALRRVMPNRTLLVSMAAMLVVTTYVIHPLVNHARLKSESILTASLDVMADPTSWGTVKAESDAIESHWSNRLYFGRPMGILNRFTPNQLSDLVVLKPYSNMDAGRFVSDALVVLLPQSFGFSRSAYATQFQLESAFHRKSVGADNSANYGLWATFYLFGGFPLVAIGSAGYILLLTSLYDLVFGKDRNAILALPLGAANMFNMADVSLAGVLVSAIHGGIIQWGATALIVLFAVSYGRLSVRYSGLVPVGDGA